MALHLTILCLSYAKKSDSESGSRDLSKTWSEQIDYLLKQGHRILKAERVGSGKKTKYYFTPVAAATTQNVAVITVVSLNFSNCGFALSHSRPI